MSPFKYLKNPHLVTKLIIRGMLKACKLAIIDLAKYNVKKLSQKILHVPPQAIDRLPLRYLVFIYGSSILGTIHLWGIIFALFSGEGLSVTYFIFATILFYSLSLLVVRSYPQGFFASLINFASGIVRRINRIIEAIRETRE